MAKRYGVPYKGSKNKIADKLWTAIPTHGVANFYDIFAGGCAVTHKALESGAFDRYFANDLQGDGLRLFYGAIHGDYASETRWIDRETFKVLKDKDPFVSLCWSFGNNQKSYMYSVEIEPWKKALHWARVYKDTSLLKEFGIDSDGSRADIVANKDEYKQKYIRWWLSKQDYSAAELDALIGRCKSQIEVHEEELRQYLLEGLKSSGLTQAEVGRRLGTHMTRHYLCRSQWEFPTQEYYEKMQTFMPALTQDYNEVIGLHNLWQSLQSLQSLESLQRLEATYKSYDEVEILPNSVIYCDPPYINTNAYLVDFDHEKFYDWCEKQKELVLISEYTMPDDRFVPVWSVQRQNSMDQKNTGNVTEKLFVPKRQLQKYHDMMQDGKKSYYVELELFTEEEYAGRGKGVLS